MTLSAENMRTDRSGNIRNDNAALDHDLKEMDYGQLDRYIRMLFRGERDETFLPAAFWDDFSDSTYAGPSDGREPPSPGYFIGQEYVHYGRNKNNKENLRLRGDIEKTLVSIIDESLAIEGEPDKLQRVTAFFAVEAVECIRATDGPNSPSNQFIAQIEQAGEEGMNWGEAQKLLASLDYPPIEVSELTMKASKLANDPRFQNGEELFPFYNY